MTKALEFKLETVTDDPYIPPRQFIYRDCYILGNLTGVCSAGGVGKTTLVDAEMASIAIGVDLLNDRKPLPAGPMPVLILSLEDDREEFLRRREALIRHYKIEGEELALYRRNLHYWIPDWPISLVTKGESGLEINKLVQKKLKEAIQKSKIKVLSIDPLVSIHNVNENSNGEMQTVVSAMKKLASDNKICVNFIHHNRKHGNKQASIDDIRGGVALREGSRCFRMLGKLHDTQTKKLGMPKDIDSNFIQEQGGKNNFSASSCAKTIYEIVSVNLMNGNDAFKSDHVGVATKYDNRFTSNNIKANPFENVDFTKCQKAWDKMLSLELKERRAYPTAKKWVGKEIATLLDVDHDTTRMIFEQWEKTGLLIYEKKSFPSESKQIPVYDINEKIYEQLIKDKKMY